MTGGLHKRVLEPATTRPEQDCAGAALTADGEAIAPADLTIDGAQRRKSLAGGVRSMENGGGSASRSEGGPAKATCAVWKTPARLKAAEILLRAVLKERWNLTQPQGVTAADRQGPGRYLPRESGTFLGFHIHPPQGRVRARKPCVPAGGYTRRLLCLPIKKTSPTWLPKILRPRKNKRPKARNNP